MFPDRVEKVVKQFQLIRNCTNKSNYEWDRDTVAKVWCHILQAMIESAEDYGLKVSFTINDLTISEVVQSGSIQSLFENRLTQGKGQSSLF